MKIIDNAINYEDFNRIKSIMTSLDFQWFYNHSVEFDSSNYGGYDSNYYFTHLFMFNEGHDDKYVHSTSDWFDILTPIIGVLKPKSLIRVKGNMYPSTPKIIHHKNHVDMEYEHKGALFYINSNDGLTVLHDGTEIESVENRLLLFDASKEHHSTTCTNDKVRINVNFNYF